MKLKDLTVAQRKRLASLAKISDGGLRHAQTGRRNLSADAAIKLERAAKRIGLDLPREGLCAACGKCELAKIARGPAQSGGGCLPTEERVPVFSAA